MEKNSRLTMWALLPLAVLTLICRIWQNVTCIDYETGFFYDDGGFWRIALYILLALSAGIIAVLIYFDKKRQSTAFSKIVSDLSPKQTAALGFVFLFDACCGFYDIIRGFNGKMNIGLIGDSLMVIVLLAASFILLSNKSIKPIGGYILVLLSLGYTVKSAALFISDTVVIRESSKLLVLLSYISAVLFFLALGRFLSKNETKYTRIKLLFFSCATFLINVASVAAAFISMILGPSPVNEEIKVTAYSELGTCVVALAVIICLYQKSIPAAVETESAEKS